jgi:DNA-binding beta-propeller fold protein YncE
VLICAGSLISAADITTIAGTGEPESSGDAGLGHKFNVGDPFGVEIGPDGSLYITEVRNHRVLRLDLTTGQISTFAGNGQKGYSGDGGAATKAQLNEPYEVRFDSAGNMLFVEMQNHLIRRVDAKTGVISTVAGTGVAGYGGDGGPALKAQFRQPHSIALDKQDNIYVADIGNHRIRKIDAKTRAITSIAGNGEKKLPVAGQTAADSPVVGPRALFIDDGVLWVALREGHSIWRLKLGEGTWQQVAGTGKKGFTGDGGPASEATFDGPKGIAIGADKNVYVVDTENHAIRLIDTQTGKIGTIAGRGPDNKGSSGDGGPAAAGLLNRPHGICVARDGSIYIGDTLNHRVRRVK